MASDTGAEALRIFCRQVRSRSIEHQEAMALLSGKDLHAVQLGILRQELDSLIRVMFLLTECDSEERERLVRAATQGDRWTVQSSTGKSSFVTDREMVDLAARLHGWAKNVYVFGCGFIHLTHLHDYGARDPFQALPWDERERLVQYLLHYHGGTLSNDATFNEVAGYVPKIFVKISKNLESYLQYLEAGHCMSFARCQDQISKQ